MLWWRRQERRLLIKGRGLVLDWERGLSLSSSCATSHNSFSYSALGVTEVLLSITISLPNREIVPELCRAVIDVSIAKHGLSLDVSMGCANSASKNSRARNVSVVMSHYVWFPLADPEKVGHTSTILSGHFSLTKP